MKRILAILLITLFLIACETGTNNTPQGDKDAPEITLFASRVEFRSPGTLTLTATTTDNVGVSKVEFYEGDTKIAEATTAPYALEVPIESGDNIVRNFLAKALDEAGNVGSSLAVTVTVNIELGSLEINALIPPAPSAPSGMTLDRETVTILVTGPNGFGATVNGNEDEALRDLEFGTYTITPSDAIGLHPVVNARVEAEVQTIELSPSNPADFISVTYRVRPHTNKLWLAVRDENKLVALERFFVSPADPVIAIGTGANSGADSVAFDKAGNLWMVARDANKLLMFIPEQLATSGTPTATVTLDGTGFMSSSQGLAFDKNNNLWVTNFASDTVLRYTANELTTSGAPTPDVLTSPDLDAPSGIAFDETGSLWVANRSSGVVSRFLMADLTTFNNVAAKVKLTATSPYGLAFDKDGNLWTSNADENTLMRFPAQQLNNATVAPDITLGSVELSLATPTGLAFDNSGHLYVSNFDSETLTVYEPPSLVATGNPEPRVRMMLIGNIGSGFFTFNLPPEHLPLAR